MPQKSWAVGEEVLAADFNTYLQNQTIPAFTGTAQRDSQWSAPPNGAFCVTVDTGTVWQRVGGTWWSPFRRQNLTTRATPSASAAAESIVLTSGVVAGIPSGRIIRVEGGWYAVAGSSGEAVIVRLREGTTITGTLLQSCVVVLAAAGAQVGTGPGGYISTSYTPAAGSKQWVLTTASTTANPVYMNAGANALSWLEINDEGAA